MFFLERKNQRTFIPLVAWWNWGLIVARAVFLEAVPGTQAHCAE
jgi:hypothetical protein